jgi:hypothetical protein
MSGGGQQRQAVLGTRTSFAGFQDVDRGVRCVVSGEHFVVFLDNAINIVLTDFASMSS